MELGAVTGVHGHLTSHDEAILKQLSNVLAYTKVIIKFCKLKSDTPIHNDERVFEDPLMSGRNRSSSSGLTGVGKFNFASFIGIYPNSSLSTLEHGGSQPLLQSQKCHNRYSLIINDYNTPFRR